MVRKTILTLISIFVLGIFLTASNYLPLNVGNEYHYDVFDMVRNVVGHVDNEITNSATAGGWVYYKNSNFLNKEVWLTSDGNGNVGFYTSYGPSLLYNFSANDGESWTVYLDGSSLYYGITATISHLDGTITVPAGTFNNPVRITYNVPEDAPVGTVLKQYFVDGIGLVKEVIKDSNGLVKSVELRSAVVDGHTYVSNGNNGGNSNGGGVIVEVGTDKYNYTLHYRSRGASNGPGYYADINVHLTVKNNSGNPIVINRLNGQKYDIKVYDKNGNVIYDWANGRYFIQSVGKTTINAGSSVTFNETISVKFPDQGVYRIEMGTEGSMAFAGTVYVSCVMPVLYNEN